MGSITNYIRSGEKHRQTHYVGMEIEHFILHKDTGLPMPYADIERLFDQIESNYPQKTYEKGHIVALGNEEMLITLEPGCQLEFSFRYTDHIEEIEKMYQKAMRPIQSFVESNQYSIVYSGGIPSVPVDAYDRIDKDRYQYMEAYFSHSGTRGKEMMKGTASIHASIDFADEADFIQKYRMANILHPLFALICFNTPKYAGKPNTDILLRDSIWQHTDPQRCHIIDDLFAPTFGYESYERYVLDNPLILMHEKDQFIPTGEQTCREVAETYGFGKPEIEHYLSMVFPDIRLKKCIEIRSADSMPLPQLLAYASFIKGLFYDEKIIHTVNEWTHSIDAIQVAKQSIQKDGWQGQVYGHNVQSLVEELMAASKSNLSIKEQGYLKALGSQNGNRPTV